MTYFQAIVIGLHTGAFQIFTDKQFRHLALLQCFFQDKRGKRSALCGAFTPGNACISIYRLLEGYNPI